MNKINKNIVLLLAGALFTTSCNFLDVVPDEIPTEKQAFSNPRAAEQFLYSCYSFMPDPRAGGDGLDLFTGDETISTFEHETFANFPKGNFTANNPVISYWNTLFAGIKQCYRLKRNISEVPSISDEVVKDYTAQADFLIAYYHFLLIRCYGAIILIKEEPDINTKPEDFLARSPFDEGVQWVCDKFDQAAASLPDVRTEQRYGLATRTAALAIKARLLLFAASPLFNGNSAFYSNLRNNDGTPLMPLTYDANKWQKAKQALKEAISAAESAGFRLYVSTDATDTQAPEPADPNQRAVRFTIIDKNSKEIIWADTRREGAYALQNKCRPMWGDHTWNGISPTVAMLDRFYSERGLPINEDTTYDYDGRFNVGTFATADNLVRGEGQTTKMNIGREPRYYAWISFHGGYYECLGLDESNRTERWAYHRTYKRGISDKKLVTHFTKYGNCGKQNRTDKNYAPAGFLNKKGVSPKSNVSDSGSAFENYPWPVVRLAELYLSYAEACVETGDLAEAKTYLNKVRQRAGIPDVDTSWGYIGVSPDQNKLRDIVRQERMIELYLENHNFWDMRRWLLAETYFGATPQGLNVNGENITDLSRKTTLTQIIRKFVSPAHYLLPIPYTEVQKNTNLVQNVGY